MNRRILQRRVDLFRSHVAKVMLSASEERKAERTLWSVESYLFRTSREGKLQQLALAEWGKQLQRDEIIGAFGYKDFPNSP